MFRIRRIYDDLLPANQTAIAACGQILAAQFAVGSNPQAPLLAEILRNPFLQQFKSILYVADNRRAEVLGFALVMHDPDAHFCYLDYLAADEKVKGRGVGAALYERIREDARTLKCTALFFECLPDDPAACRDETLRKQNASRLKFYERYGARPIIGTAYETPFVPGQDDCWPYLMFDGLGHSTALPAARARRTVRAILERKYGHLCPPGYIDRVVASFRDNPVKLRELRYVKTHPPASPVVRPAAERLPTVVTDRHELHHVRERGYVEAPARIDLIAEAIRSAGMVTPLPIRTYPLSKILAVHDADLVNYLQKACAQVPPGKSVYPYVFPIRNATRPPRDMGLRAGYYCIDTFTPIHANAFTVARRAVDCTLSAADEVLSGSRFAYALVRPPGHHAERRTFGGFCYFSNAAVAAQHLSSHGRVAILDIDYHHGNGQQDIFYERPDVFTVSIHGDPEFAYPYFCGFAEEQGAGDGLGRNLNIPLPELQDGAQYRTALGRALQAIADFRPMFLVVCLGLDTARGDPTGTWSLTGSDMEHNGRMIAELKLPTLIVQEGGYRTRTLGANARHFFTGLLRAGGGTRRMT